MPREWALKLTVEGNRHWISLNHRDHYRARAAKTKAWREYTRVLTHTSSIPALTRATITGHIYKPHKRRYDPHNLFPTMKAIVDGIVDAGVLEDDDHTHLTVALTHGGIDRSQPPHLIITITEEQEDPNHAP